MPRYSSLKVPQYGSKLPRIAQAIQLLRRRRSDRAGSGEMMSRVDLRVVSFFDNANDIADFKVAKRTTN